MSDQISHPHDEDLLLYAGGELGPSSGEQLRLHLGNCSQCRDRLRELQNSLNEFRRAHQDFRHAELFPADRARFALQSRLRQLATQNKRMDSRFSWPHAYRYGKTVALAGVALVACLALAVWLRRPVENRPAVLASIADQEEPDLRLTPGATIPVTENDICSAASETVPSIPVSLEQRVFALYKVTQSTDQFEVDYLITPELGGATDIRNLWPEPYHNTVWNAHVKDQLEDRLHRMVCHGDLDLVTAQRDLSTDWIAAYRKYFHTDHPISDTSTHNLSSRTNLLPAA